MADFTRLLLVILWLVDAALMLCIGYTTRAVRPYVYGLLFIPIINVLFYAVNLLWRLGFVEVPGGFFGALSNYRNWATGVNILLVLCTFIVISWMKRR